MLGATAVLLLAFLAQVHATDQAAELDSQEDTYDRSADRAVGELLSRANRRSSSDTDLETAALAKSGTFSVPSSAKPHAAMTTMHRGLPSSRPLAYGPQQRSRSTSDYALKIRRDFATNAEGETGESVAEAKSEGAAAAVTPAPKDKPLPGSAVNLYDPAATASRWLTRRFGIVGGLGLVGALALVEGNEFFQALREDFATKDVATIEEKTLANGLKYKDLKVGGGAEPKDGDFVGVQLVIRSGDQVILDTKEKSKPIAFVYGKPVPGYPGLEEGIKGMKRAGVRTVTFPAGADGTALSYTIEVTEVSPAYFVNQ